MKTVIKAKSFFKKVSASAAVRAGEKRNDLEWSFHGFAPEEVSGFASQHPEKVCFVLNQFVESFGRKLIAAKGDDWDFCPAPEAVCFDAAYQDATSVTTRSRTVTKETLSKLAQFYVLSAPKLGISSASAVAGSRVIESKFGLIASKADAIAVMKDRLLQLVEVCDPDEVAPHAEVIEALLSLADELSNVEITVEAL